MSTVIRCSIRVSRPATSCRCSGRIDATGYGRLEADFVTQFMPAAQLSSALTQENIDSIKALFFVPNGSFVGDSLAPMGLEIYRLNKQLPSTIFSNFNPADYYSSSDLLATKMYVCNALGQPDSIRNLSYRLIDVHLPVSLAHEFLFRCIRPTPRHISSLHSSPVISPEYM